MCILLYNTDSARTRKIPAYGTWIAKLLCVLTANLALKFASKFKIGAAQCETHARRQVNTVTWSRVRLHDRNTRPCYLVCYMPGDPITCHVTQLHLADTCSCFILWRSRAISTVTWLRSTSRDWAAHIIFNNSVFYFGLGVQCSDITYELCNTVLCTV